MISPAKLFELSDDEKKMAADLEKYIDDSIQEQNNANPTSRVFTVPLPATPPSAKIVGHVLAKYRKGDETIGKMSRWGAEVTTDGFKMTMPSDSRKGRPPMTPEAKAAAKAAREAAKAAAAAVPPAVTTPPVVTTSPEIVGEPVAEAVAAA
jgi:hypothetical protein